MTCNVMLCYVIPCYVIPCYVMYVCMCLTIYVIDHFTHIIRIYNNMYAHFGNTMVDALSQPYHLLS